MPLIRMMLMVSALALAGCSTTRTPPADVTRFHLGQPIPVDTIAIVPAPGIDGKGLEFRSQAAVVAGELAANGFRPVEFGGNQAYLGIVKVEESLRSGPPRGPRFSLGLGGSTGGFNSGVGGGVTVPIGQGRSGDIRTILLSVQIRRHSDNSMVWEGRASQDVAADAAGTPLAALSRALFAGFPGPSGQTVKVKTAR